MSSVKHIGLILDGNRRYAKSQNIPLKLGHKKGAEIFLKSLEILNHSGVTQVTAYVISTENLKREASQVADLFSLFTEFFEKCMKEDKLKASVHFIGEWNLFDSDIQSKMRALEEKTASIVDKRVNLCFGYGGRAEILAAAKQIALAVQKGELDPNAITEDTFTHALHLPTDPQLIVRTGGKTRTSNFLPWQSVYSEWYFEEKMWPEVTEADIQKWLNHFDTVQRNFGK